jgi:Tfp pilus assembly protein PilX
MTSSRVNRCGTWTGQSGVALIAVMMAVLILTLVVAALVVATMGESALSFDQLRGSQAGAVAEAAAYRALAELRRRIEVDLRNEIELSGTAGTIRAICSNAVRNREIITTYANPAGGPAWTDDGSQAILDIGTAGSPIVMTARDTGMLIGTFHARILVRRSGRAAICTAMGTVPERYEMWFDYAIVATGISGNGRRTVCLRSPGADTCSRWVAGSPAGSNTGFPVLVARSSYSQRALLVFGSSDVWMFDTSEFPGPVHMNQYLQIWGGPLFSDTVSQSGNTVRFGNSGNPVFLPASSNPPYDVPRGNQIVRGAPTIPPPDLSSNPARAAVGLAPTGSDPTGREIREGTTDLADNASPVPQGAYVMDQMCGAPVCGGIYISGNVSRLVLAVESGLQVVYVRVPGAGAATPASPGPDIRIVLDPAASEVRTQWGPGWTCGSSGEYCRTYPGVRLNGVIYIDGALTAGGIGLGLFGIVQQDTPLTIAADRDIEIADHLVYQRPPAGPGDNPGNVLGLWSRNGNVTIVGQYAPDNLYIDAVVLTPVGRFWVRGWDTLRNKGVISFLGSTVQQVYGEFGGFDPITGYGRSMTYDWRLRSNVSPPFFPMTPGYTAIRTPGLPDPLYDKPHWEEVVGQ